MLTTLCVRMVCNCKEELVGDISTRLISTNAKRMLKELVKNTLVMDIVVDIDIRLGDLIYVL